MSREAKHSYSSVVQEDGSILVHAKFADGEERDYTLPVWDGSTLSNVLLSYAAAGLESKLKSFINGGGSADFDKYAELLAQGPDVRRPRAVDPTKEPKLDPLQAAVFEFYAAKHEADPENVKAYSKADVVNSLAKRSREERAALKNDPRIAPIYARIKAEADAAKAAKAEGDADKQDLLDLDL